MPMRIAAPLLALLGHELRAPAGVVGGYLALLEQSRDSFTPDQRKALAGARRAQQTLVEGLDDLRRLTVSWHAEDEPLTWVALPTLVQEVRSLAASRGVPLTIATAPAVSVPRRGRDAALADALTTVAEAVAREHGAAVVASTDLRDRALVWRVRPADAGRDDQATRREFHLWRPGLGVRLITAAVTITASHGTLDDLWADEARHGVDVTFDLDAASVLPPPFEPG
jgi:light-regulated signal transduction histidine kinase (bacteriophytochrome)